MSLISASTRRVVVGAVVGSGIGMAVLGREAMPLALVISLTAVAWGLFTTWEQRKRWSAIDPDVRLRWMELPGAAIQPDGLIHVHHGTQPLWVRLLPESRAVIATRVGMMPVGFRIWPWHHPPPEESLRGPRVGGPALEPAPGLEEALGHQLHVESNDAQALGRLLDTDVIAPILAAGDPGSSSFAGLTYDGELLMIHLAGPVAGDPQRGTHLARLLWEPWTA